MHPRSLPLEPSVIQKADERVTDPRRVLVATLGLAGVYFAAGKLGLSMARDHPSASAVWPPTGIALAALLIWGQRLWPGVFLGAFLVILAASTRAPASGSPSARGSSSDTWAGSGSSRGRGRATSRCAPRGSAAEGKKEARAAKRLGPPSSLLSG